MSPFALGTWSIVGNIGAGGGISPLLVAYSPQGNIICCGKASSGPIFSFNPGQIVRSDDNGATWGLVLDFTTLGDFNSAPVSITRLHDPLTNNEMFVAAVVRVTFAGPTNESARVRIYTSPTGEIWTARQILADAPGVGAAGAVGGRATAVATRPRVTDADPLEHYLFVRAQRDAVVDRGLYKSVDLGITWTLVADPGEMSAPGDGSTTGTLISLPDRTLLASNLNGGSARSTDGGQSWTPANPNFNPSALASFGGGPVIGARRGTLTGPEQTQISCDDARSWPALNQGPQFGLGTGAVTAQPVLVMLGAWEVLMAGAGFPLGTVEAVYSDNGGETETLRLSLDTGTGVVSHLAGGCMLADGRPIIIVGQTGHVFRSSDVPAGEFGDRIYCVTAPAPGVGFPGFPDPCGDFYNPCPQDCPAEPEQPAGVFIDIPPAHHEVPTVPYGELALMYGVDDAIYGGDPHDPIIYPVLGLPAGCGNTFINEPCAAGGCPVPA